MIQFFLEPEEDGEEDGSQTYLVFQLMDKYFKRVAGVGSGNYIYFWKCKGFFDEKIDSITASNYCISPELSYYNTKIKVKFKGSCLKQDKITYNHRKIVNIYIYIYIYLYILFMSFMILAVIQHWKTFYFEQLV